MDKESEQSEQPAPERLFGRVERKEVRWRRREGRIFRAYDHTHGREVGLFLVRRGIASDESALEALKKAVQQARRLNHPQIVPILEFLSDGTYAGYLFEWRAHLQVGDVPDPSEETLGRWTRQLCSALLHAFELGILHLDLHPENLWVTPSGDLLVFDFCVGRVLSDEVGRITGRPPPQVQFEYQSPDLREGGTPVLQDDVFSLGRILRDWYFGDNSPRLSLQAEVNLRALVEKCLDRNPDQRPRNMRDVIGMLEPLPGRPSSRPTASPVAWAALLIAALALLLEVYYRFQGTPVEKSGESPPTFTGSRPPEYLLELDQVYTNSLGMPFQPVGEVLIGRYETRRRDFATFVEETGYLAVSGTMSYTSNGWEDLGFTWQDPGFLQSGDHPVVCVSYHDAVAFCTWLTQREIAAGRLGRDQAYRLLTETEWLRLVGDRYYVWGDDWPPGGDVANLAGTEVMEANWPPDGVFAPDHFDGYARTAPVGSFRPDESGCYDVAGNVWEWGEETLAGDPATRRLFGGSWHNSNPSLFEVTWRNGNRPDARNGSTGFRCVLANLRE